MRIERAVSSIFLLIALCLGTSQAQDHWSWPEKPKNLQVLPKDWPGARLRPVMFGFTRALGVRCAYCHVGEEGKPLSTYDFASDANPNKDRAREMLRMLGDINEHLKKIDSSSDHRVNMWCHTCHRGRPRPTTLEEELGERYRAKGIQPTIDLYAELKTKFYDRGSYDFGERSLNDFGYELLDKDAPAAIQIFRLNTENFPQSGNAWDSLAEAYEKAGDRKNAQADYEKAISLDPTLEHSKERLKELKQPPAK
jgi:tetratricopeptide (TPR) repeat protein